MRRPLFYEFQSAATLLTMLVLAGLATGCGAKTGLTVPELEREPEIIEPEMPCFEIPFDGEPIELEIELEVRIQRADVLFLIDHTQSMGMEISAIREGLRDVIVPAIASEIPDSQLGAAIVADFPVREFGASDDQPFQLVVPMTDDLTRVQAGLDGINLGQGGDLPESQVEALYQVATGEGLDGFIPPSFGCPMGGFGYPCFRNDALSIVLLVTDDLFHNGPGGVRPYSGITPTPHTYAETIDELTDKGIRVIGLYSGASSFDADLRTVATDTGAVDASGSPLVFNIGRDGEDLGTGVIDAIRTFAREAPIDVDAIVSDVDLADAINAADFVERVSPVRAEPENGITGIEGDSFLGVEPGTRLFFSLTVRNDAVVPGPEPQRFEVEVTFRGDRRSVLDRQIVEIVVPGADGAGCEAL